MTRYLLIAVAALFVCVASSDAQSVLVDVDFDTGYPEDGFPINGFIDSYGQWLEGDNQVEIDTGNFRSSPKSIRYNAVTNRNAEYHFTNPVSQSLVNSTEDLVLEWSYYRPATNVTMQFVPYGGDTATQDGELGEAHIDASGVARFAYDDSLSGYFPHNFYDPGSNLTGWWDWRLTFNNSGSEGIYKEIEVKAPGETSFTAFLDPPNEARFRSDGNMGPYMNYLRMGQAQPSPGSREGAFDSIKISQFTAIQETFERTWASSESGNWHVNGNWVGGLGGAPGGADPIRDAVFGGEITSPRVVFTETDVTVNSVRFDNPVTYAVTGLGAINVMAGTDASLAPTGVIVEDGSHVFQAAVSLHDDSTVNVASNSTLTFDGALNLMGHTLTKTGAGTMALNNLVTLGGGTLIAAEGMISGNGTIGGDLNNEGSTISPGNSAGVGGSSVVPEPSTLLLVLCALVALAALARRR